jgi:hypothetical protein
MRNRALTWRWHCEVVQEITSETLSFAVCFRPGHALQSVEISEDKQFDRCPCGRQDEAAYDDRRTQFLTIATTSPCLGSGSTSKHFVPSLPCCSPGNPPMSCFDENALMRPLMQVIADVEPFHLLVYGW